MSETPGERQTGIDKYGREQVGPADANAPAPGSRTRQAGGEFLKALAGDLAAVLSRVGMLGGGQRRRTPQRPASPRPTIGRRLWRLSVAFLAFVTICAGALSAVTLLVLFNLALETRKIDRAASKSQVEAGTGGSLGGVGSSAPDAARPSQATGETRIATGAQAEPQDRRATLPQTMSPALTDLRSGGQCAVDLCTARYRSFNAADCTYQPYGGGPRSLCELGTPSPGVTPQTPQATTDPGTEAERAQVAEGAEEIPTTSSLPVRAGGQCNVAACAATYKSFNAADCTYQPYDGGPRRICVR